MRFKVSRKINRDNLIYDMGDEIWLSEGEAKPLLECGAIEPFIKPFGKKSQPAALNINRGANEND